MDDASKSLLLKTVSRLPDWVRHDLAAKEITARQRAEETLVAMIANALENDTRDGAHD